MTFTPAIFFWSYRSSIVGCLPIVLCCALLFNCCLANGQSGADWLQLKFPYECSDCSVEDILYELNELPNVNLTFNNLQVRQLPQVTIPQKTWVLQDLLSTLLRNSRINFEPAGSQVVLFYDPNKSMPLHTVGGYVLDSLSGEALIGCTVVHPLSGKVAITNGYGFFSLQIPIDQPEIIAYFLGYIPKAVRTNQGTEQVIIPMANSIQLQEVVIRARRNEETNVVRLPSLNFITENQLIANVSPGGEPDPIRVVHTLAGVQTGADGFGGMSVQGGNVDQNLFILDDVPIYDATHGVGVYSIFNSEAIRDARLWKGVLPARYGGRLSSVCEVRTREGNLNKFAGGLNVGLTSATAYAEGPFRKERGAFFASFRRSFFDLYSRPISRAQREADGIRGDLGYYFQDLNLKLNYQFNANNRLYFSFYRGEDQFRDRQITNFTNADTTIVVDQDQNVDWGNSIAALRWNHLFSNRLFVNTVATFSRFGYNTENRFSVSNFVNLLPFEEFALNANFSSNNRDLAIRTDFDWFANEQHQLRWGIGATHHQLVPGIITIDDNATTIEPNSESPQHTIESVVYIDEEWRPVPKLLINAGLRLTHLAGDGYRYLEPEPRLSLSYKIHPQFTLNAAVGRHAQMLNLLSSSGVGLPRDLWIAAGERVGPATADLFTAGINYLSPNGNLNIHLGAYRKDMRGLILLQEGLIGEISAENWEDQVSVGQGLAQGLEFNGSYQSGNWQTWWSYTLSKSTRNFGPSVNSGNTFPYRLDRRHNFSFSVSRNLPKNWLLTAAYTLASGSAFSLPVSRVRFNQTNQVFANIYSFPFILEVLNYSSRNSSRLPNYHHVDCSARKQWTYRRFRTELSFGLYNVYNQENPLYYSLRLTQNDQGETGTFFSQTTLFPAFPFCRYRVDF